MKDRFGNTDQRLCQKALTGESHRHHRVQAVHNRSPSHPTESSPQKEVWLFEIGGLIVVIQLDNSRPVGRKPLIWIPGSFVIIAKSIHVGLPEIELTIL